MYTLTEEDYFDLSRPQRTGSGQGELFEDAAPWQVVWRGMPDFEQKDVSPEYRITINFLCFDDVKEFAEKLGITVTQRTDSLWYPQQKRLNGQFEYRGRKTDSKYPVCIPSKGRADCHKTPKQLERLGVKYRVFVEETEYDEYAKFLAEDRLVKMPFHDLGQGSIPARNFIWEWALERGFKRHWTVDDNINAFVRLHNNRRLNVRGGGFFRAMEDFVDRYENIAMAGPHDKAFAPDRSKNLAPYLFNSRVYSCILLDTSLPIRWRGRYNEDTDLSLRLLKDGYCTVLFRALLMDKGETYYGNGEKTSGMKGGNSDTVYAMDDYRRAFAESLQQQHPDCVKVTWKFGRWHHQVDYSTFSQNKPILRSDIELNQAQDNYGMTLVRVDDRKS